MSATPSFSSKSFIFDPRPTYPFVSAVRRYWIPGSPHLDDKEAVTLIFAHGTGFHKELWEPVIDDLYTTNTRIGGRVKIREMWAIDCSNHGESSKPNEEALSVGPNLVFGWEEYGRSIHLFLNGLGTGVDGVDFSGHKLVGIGHSMGAAAVTLALGYYPQIKWHALLLCEPMFMPPGYGKEISDILANGAMNRRDVWPSREEAYKQFTSRGTWRTWDPRAQILFVKHGLIPLPTADYPDKEGVTLACSKIQEAACYRDSVSLFRAFAYLKHIVQQVPTHLVYGADDDYLPAAAKEAVVNNASGGVQHLASFTKVKGGHLLPFTNPTGLAEQIHKALVLSDFTGMKGRPSTKL